MINCIVKITVIIRHSDTRTMFVKPISLPRLPSIGTILLNVPCGFDLIRAATVEKIYMSDDKVFLELEDYCRHSEPPADLYDWIVEFMLGSGWSIQTNNHYDIWLSGQVWQEKGTLYRYKLVATHCEGIDFNDAVNRWVALDPDYRSFDRGTCTVTLNYPAGECIDGFFNARYDAVPSFSYAKHIAKQSE